MFKWLKNISRTELAIKVFVVFLVAQIVCCGGCSKFYDKYDIPHDSPLEEAAEDLIESKTGIRFDLSETTPERDPD